MSSSAINIKLIPLPQIVCSGEFHLGYKKSEVQGISWYQLLHWDSTKEAQAKHRLSEYRFEKISPPPSPHRPINYLLDYSNREVVSPPLTSPLSPLLTLIAHPTTNNAHNHINWIPGMTLHDELAD